MLCDVRPYCYARSYCYAGCLIDDDDAVVVVAVQRLDHKRLAPRRWELRRGAAVRLRWAAARLGGGNCGEVQGWKVEGSRVLVQARAAEQTRKPCMRGRPFRWQ